MISVYLACPYAHENPQVMEDRVAVCAKVTHYLNLRSIMVYSPILVAHMVRKHNPGQAMTWDYWRPIDFKWLAAMTDLWVLNMPGLSESIGCRGEIKQAKALGKALHLLDPIRHRIEIDRILMGRSAPNTNKWG